VIALIGASLLSASLGFAASTLIKSPAQIAAESTAPPRTALTAPVTMGTIDNTLAFAGSVVNGNSIELSPPPPTAADAVVTATPLAVGSAVAPGSVLIVVADRPLIVLPGGIPLIRDLERGATGDDVARLQDGLRGAGLPVTDKPGVFGRTTQTALTALYAAAGFSAPRGAGGGVAALRSELVFAPDGATGRITAIGGQLGGVVKNPLVTLTTRPTVVTAEISPADAKLLTVGNPVTIAGSGVVTGEGTIVSISAPAKGADGGFRCTVVVQPSEELSPASVDTQVQVAAPTGSEEEPGLLVPLSGVYSAADGSTYVLTAATTKPQRVAVEVIATGDGLAMVVARDGSLAEGDDVIVGAG
jgi:hypothetical protein